MATVVKNFKVKNGIVIEGATGTLNGSNLVTENASQTLNNKALGGNLNADGNTITNLAAPSSNGDAATKGYTDTAASSAQNAATTYTDTRETAITSAYQAYADQAELDAIAAANAHTNSAISDLVGAAPDLLNTLSELSDALGDDANFATNITNTITTGDSSTLQSANSYTDSAVAALGVGNLTTDDITEGTAQYFTAQRAVDAIQAVVPNFTEVDINGVSTQFAAQSSVATAGQSTVYSFSKTSYRSAELLVKASTADHSEVTKVLLTLDGLDNIAITEYGTVGTNGSLFSVTATVNLGNVDIVATTTNNNTDVLVSGTLLA